MKEIIVRNTEFNFENPELNARCHTIATHLKEHINGLKNAAIEAYNLDKDKTAVEIGYKNTADFLMEAMGLNKTFAYDLVAIGRRLASPKMGLLLGSFGASHIKEMATMTDDEIEESIESGELSPDMTTKQVREVAKAHKKSTRATPAPKKYWFIPMTGAMEVGTEFVSQQCLVCTESDFELEHIVYGEFTKNGEKYFVVMEYPASESSYPMLITYLRSKSVPVMGTVENAETVD